MKRRSFDTLVIVLLFCLFLFLALAEVWAGVSVYKRMYETANAEVKAQTAVLYVMNKVRQNDCGAIRIGTLPDGTQTLELDSEIDGDLYTTSLYCYDGKLRELFTPKNITLDADIGTPLVDLDHLEFEGKDGWLKVTFEMTDGSKRETVIATISEAGVMRWDK